MVKFIESELVLLKKEIDEMWTLCPQADRIGSATVSEHCPTHEIS